MKLNRDHFDRGFASSTDRSDEKEPRRSISEPAYITSKRGNRYISRATCPVCFAEVGVTDQGTLRSGERVFWIATHSPSARSRRHGQPVCTGTGVRVERGPDGNWRQHVAR